MADFKKRLMEELMKGAIPQAPPITKDLGPYSQGAPEEADLPYDENDLMKGAIPEGKPVPESKNPLPSEMPKAEEDDSSDEGDDISDEGDDSSDDGESVTAPAVASDSKDTPVTPAASQEAPKPGAPAYYSDLMNRFKAAQEKSNTNRSLNDFGRYASAATAGMRGVQRNPELEKVMEDEGKRADLPVQEFMQQFQLEGQDPSSVAAQSMREVYGKALGIDPTKLAGMNFPQMEKSFHLLGADANNKLKIQSMGVANQIKQQMANQNAEKNKETSRQHDMQNKNYADRTAMMKDKQAQGAANKISDTEQKDLKDLGVDLDKPLAARGGNIGKVQAVDHASQRIDALLSRFPDGNIPKIATEELATSVASLISGGSPRSQHQIAALVPHSMVGNAMDIASWITNEPLGKEQQAFIHQLADTNKVEGDLARSQLVHYKLSTLPKAERLRKSNPEAFYNFVGAKIGVDPEWIKNNYNPKSVHKSMEKMGKESGSSKADASYDGSTKLPNPTPEQAQKRMQYLQNKAGQ